MRTKKIVKKYLLHGWPDTDDAIIFDSWYVALCNYQANRKKWKSVIPINCMGSCQEGTKWKKSSSFVLVEGMLTKSNGLEQNGSYTAPAGRIEHLYKGYVVIKVKLFPRHYWRGKIIKP